VIRILPVGNKGVCRGNFVSIGKDGKIYPDIRERSIGMVLVTSSSYGSAPVKISPSLVTDETIFLGKKNRFISGTKKEVLEMLGRK